MRKDEKRIEWPSELSSEHLPEVGTVMFGGNFLVLNRGDNFLDVGFGDAGKGFAGLHRFEILRGSRKEKEGDEKEGEVEISYLSVSCNPSVDRKPFPNWVWVFHRWYAMALFRDGVREVLGL